MHLMKIYVQHIVQTVPEISCQTLEAYSVFFENKKKYFSRVYYPLCHEYIIFGVANTFFIRGTEFFLDIFMQIGETVDQFNVFSTIT